MLHITNSVPDDFLHCEPTELHKVLEGPTLVHLEGKIKEPLFVSGLLHGNEPVGFRTLQNILHAHENQPLPRSLSFFVGNISAAAENKRRLDGQPDYNRIWKGNGSPEHQMAMQVIDEMKKKQIFASIDIHNNTGRNPHYGCVNNLNQDFLNLVALFGRLVVYFLKPDAVQSMAFSKLCPAVTLECGHPDDESGVEHATRFVEKVLNLEELPNTVSPDDLDIYHTIATVKIPPDVNFSFTDTSSELFFEAGLEEKNFIDVPSDFHFAQVKNGATRVVDVINEAGENVTEKFFEIKNGKLKNKRSVIPSMFTSNEWVIRQDCLCYLMEPYLLD